MFERPELLWLISLVPLVWWSGWRATNAHSRGLQFALAGLRTGVLVALVALLAGLQVKTRVRTGRLEVVAMLDESRSIDPSQLDAMRRQVLRLARSMDRRDSLSVLAFGADIRVLAEPASVRDVGSLEGSVNGDATDIASALTVAVGMFAPDAEKKLWLLSDGNETQGDALQEIPMLVASGVQVFASLPPPVTSARVALVGIYAPEVVRAGFTFPLRLDIESEAERDVEARLSVQDSFGRPVERLIRLHQGLNRYALPFLIPKPGASLITSKLEVEPHVRVVNSSLTTSVAVSPAPRVLVVSNDSPTSILKVLGMRGYEAASAKPSDLQPDATSFLLGYQAVVLDDVSSDALRPELQETLKTYVSEYGGGVIVTGNTLRDSRFMGSVLESFLPVRFRPQPPPPQREPVAIYLLIDRSNSMGYNSRYPTIRDEERIRYAKQAALALLRQLDDADFVGVIAFDSDPYVLMPLQPLGGHRRALEARIAALEPGGGTDFKQALEIAERQILATDVRTRQVILLTDGDTNREYHDHDQLMADFARQNIPVSTIRIGPDTENLKLLQDFAELTHGVFYRVDDITTLPELLVRLSHKSTDAHSIRHLRVTVAKRNAILAGIESDKLPPVEFYSLSEPKERATVSLAVEHQGGQAPLVASWQFGLGRVATFAADPESVGSVRWLQWDRYAQFWSQLITWTMRPRLWQPFDLSVRVERDGAIQIIAQNNDRVPAESLFCRVVSSKGASEIPMTPVSPNEYRADMGTMAPGEYTFYLVQKKNDQEKTLASLPYIATGTVPSLMEELRLRPPNRQLLERLTQATGGSLNPSLQQLLQHNGRRVVRYRPATGYLVPIAISLMLIEIYLRRRLVGNIT